MSVYPHMHVHSYSCIPLEFGLNTPIVSEPRCDIMVSTGLRVRDTM